jgi:hypothetical protein
MNMSCSRAHRSRSRLIALVTLGSAAGAGAMYLLDPIRGRRRRQAVRQRTAGAIRDIERSGSRRIRFRAAVVRGRWKGLAHRLRPTPPPELDDAELAHKVQSIVFRDRNVPKGRISINAEDGCVVLRGQVDQPELIAELEQSVRRIAGVRDVENLLHPAGAPAPERRPRRRMR